VGSGHTSYLFAIVQDPRRLPASAIRFVDHEHGLPHGAKILAACRRESQVSWLERFPPSTVCARPLSLTISPASGEDSIALGAILRGPPT
jgi:hypothetical protein